MITPSQRQKRHKYIRPKLNTICQECFYMCKSVKEYHPYWHCVLAKAGQLDIAKAAIQEKINEEVMKVKALG